MLHLTSIASASPDCPHCAGFIDALRQIEAGMPDQPVAYRFARAREIARKALGTREIRNEQ